MIADDEGAGPSLLVSVRSAAEAREAVRGGATVIDVKEPDRGPLGPADPEVWKAIRQAVPGSVPVSVALGELRDWHDQPPPAPGSFEGIAFRKLGPAGMAGRDWASDWADLRLRWGAGPLWIAVAYLDWEVAEAPSPEEIREAALDAPDCAGVLLDTWDKTRRPGLLDLSWAASWLDPIRRSGRLVAIAGGLDADAIRRLGPLRPDLFAVRGAACLGGKRGGAVDRDRVRALVGAMFIPGDAERRRPPEG